MDDSIKLQHYAKSKSVIQRYAIDPDFEGHRLGVKDNEGWYVYEGAIKKRFHHLADDFDKLIYGTTVYKTLQFFNLPLEQKGEYKDIVAMNLFLDCDLKDKVKKQLKENNGGRSPELKEIAKKVIKFVYNAFNKLVSPDSIELYDSGGGFYCEINHRVTYFISQLDIPQEDKGLIYKELCQRFDKVFLKSVENKIRETIAEYDNCFKFDYLNNNNRQVKCPLSVHKSMPVYTHPIDPNNIDFNEEYIPINDTKLIEYSKIIDKKPDWETAKKDCSKLISILWKEYSGDWIEKLKAWVEDKKRQEKEKEEHRQEIIQRLKEKHKEIEKLEQTSNIQDIFDSLNTISMYELVELLFPTTVRPNGDIRFAPSWRSSDSGTSCFICNDHSIHDLKEKATLNVIQLMGAHLNLVSPGETPKGEDFWRCVQELRDLGFKIPEFKLPKRGRPKKNPTPSEAGYDCVDVDDKGRVKPNHHSLAMKIINEYDIYTIIDWGDKAFYYMRERGVWMNSVIHLVNEHAEDCWQDKCKDMHVNETYSKIKRRTQVYLEDLPLLPLELIPVENGLYNWEENRLYDFTPDYFYNFKIPVEYKKGAGCPKFKKFLNDVLPDEEEQKKIQEFGGYCFYRDVPTPKAFMLDGPGGNGKSQLIKVITTLIGNRNKKEIEFRDLENNPYAPAELENIHVCMQHDISSRELKRANIFKNMVDGNEMWVRQIYQKGRDIQPFCKFMWSTNQIPVCYDDSDAFYDRWEIIEFTQRIRGSDKEVKDIWKQLIEEEASGIFNFFMDGLRRLSNQGWRFTNMTDKDDAKETYKRKASSLYCFIQDVCEHDPDGFIPVKEFYRAYCDYCDRHDIQALEQSDVTKTITFWAPYVKTNQKKKINKETVTGYKYISFQEGRPDNLEPEREEENNSLDMVEYNDIDFDFSDVY